MTSVQPALPMRRLRVSLTYIAPALLLAWFAGGQMLLGRIDAALAIPWLMPGALWLGWRVRDESLAARLAIAGTALLGLSAAQALLHLWLGKSLGGAQLGLTALAGVAACGLAVVIMRYMRSWWRWPMMLAAVMAWFAAGQLLLGYAYVAPKKTPAPRLAVLTGLPLRWGGDDLAAMLAAGPKDAPALAELDRRFDLRLIDSLMEVEDDESLLVAHPRALAPAELVRLDGLTTRPRTIVILADALSSWEPPYPVGDARNPPVTSLLTPLLDHWGITLAAPDRGASGWEGDNEIFLGPRNVKLRLHSAGRFTRLPAGCARYGGRRVARCAVGEATVLLVGDADLLHDSLWRTPYPAAPWLRRSDNLAWLSGVLAPARHAALDPIWIRP